jgi:multisubunit Na+/H+ antiporter MnhB subunit
MTYIVLAFAVFLAIFLRFIIGIELRTILTVYLLGLIIYLFGFTVAEMPPFGDPGNPVFNEVSGRYLEQGVSETGAVNIVSSVILDYRAFDTLGEATVLFVAIAAVIATLKSH